MREQIDLIRSYARGVWRFRWYGLLVAWLVAAGGWAMSMQIPDQYQSWAQVHVDTQSMLSPLMRGLVIESDVERRVQMMTGTLLSRPNLEEIARKADLDLESGSPHEFARIVDDLQGRLTLSPSSRDNLYRISYRGDDPRRTHDVVQAAVSLMVEESLGRSREDAASATRFLDRKIEEYKARLQEANRKRVQFRRKHAAELAGSGGDYYQRLEERRSELQKARFELELARTRQNELERQLAGESPVFGIVQGESPTRQIETAELDQKIARLEEELDLLLLNYTEQHPRVGALREQIARFKRERDDTRERLAGQSAGTFWSGSESVDRNPVHQQIRAALAQARTDVAAAEARVDQQQRQVHELQRLVDRAPEIDARLEELTREYESIRQTYDELVTRRQTAEISGEVERSADQVEFRVVEPPRLPTKPVAPNRPLLVTVSLGAGAAGYVAIGVLLSLIWPAFYTRGSLYQSFKLPVLGNIERVWTKRERKRWRAEISMYVFSASALLGAYSIVMAIAHGHRLSDLIELVRTFPGAS